MLLALGVYLKAVVLAAVVHQKNPDPVRGVGAVVHRADAGVERIRAVVHRDNQGYLRVDHRLGVPDKALDPPLYQHEKAAQ